MRKRITSGCGFYFRKKIWILKFSTELEQNLNNETSSFPVSPLPTCYILNFPEFFLCIQGTRKKTFSLPFSSYYFVTVRVTFLGGFIHVLFCIRFCPPQHQMKFIVSEFSFFFYLIFCMWIAHKNLKHKKKFNCCGSKSRKIFYFVTFFYFVSVFLVAICNDKRKFRSEKLENAIWWMESNFVCLFWNFIFYWDAPSSHFLLQ